MKWYFVTKKIDGKAYRYRQRTYREGGKVRSQSQYVGPLSDVEIALKLNTNIQNQIEGTNPDRAEEIEALKTAVADGSYVPGQVKIAWDQKPFWPNKKQLRFGDSNTPIKHAGISISAMQAEYARVVKSVKQFGIDENRFANIKLVEGKKAGWKRNNGNYHVTLSNDGKGSGRNRFKRHYRLALAHAMLDQFEAQSPTLYNGLQRAIDHSWTNSRLLVTAQILRSKEPHRFWLTLQYLWAGSLPRTIEKQFGKQSHQKLSPYRPGTWRDEAAGLIADVMQRGYKGSENHYSKARSKAKANAKRSFAAYRKLSRLQRLTKKGRKKWHRYKNYEKAFLVAHHKKDRLEMLKPFLSEFHKK